jgi:raffinose/stachyose/melibiose transport system permease protein
MTVKNRERKFPRLTFMRFFEIVMLFLSILYFSPLLFGFISSFKDKQEIFYPLSFPASLNLENYENAFTQANYLRLLFNSILVSGVTLVIVIIIGSMVAYPLSRQKGSVFIFAYLFFLSGLMIPFQTGMVPLFQLVKSLGLMNSLGSLILVGVGELLPMTVLIFTGFMRTVPRELEEAAMIDGCGYAGRFFKIVFPLLRPAMAAVFIIDVLPVWNDFLSPLLFISSDNRMTLPVGIFTFINERGRDYGSIFAISVLAIIPPVILFLLLQKYFYSGITAGSYR